MRTFSQAHFYPFLNANGEQPACFLKYFPKSEGLAKDRISAIWAIEYELVLRRFLALITVYFSIHCIAFSPVVALTALLRCLGEILRISA